MLSISDPLVAYVACLSFIIVIGAVGGLVILVGTGILDHIAKRRRRRRSRRRAQTVAALLACLTDDQVEHAIASLERQLSERS